jgi:uncharacterized short protein YbdD (DUF466 family)
MAAADRKNRLTKVEPISNDGTTKAFPAFGENFGLRIAMAGAMPGGWSSDHRSETDKFSGWHYIAIHAIYKQIIQATVEVYEHRMTVPDISKPAPQSPGMPQEPNQESQQFPGAAPQPGSFTKGLNEQCDNMVAMPSYDPFIKKLKKPNPNQTLGSFNGERAMQLCLTGRVLIWNVRSILTGAIIERYVIPTCLASPRPPSKELPRGGWYVLPEGARYAEEAGYYMVGSLEAAFGKTIPAEDVQIIKFPHPKYKDDGQSPVSAGALWTDTSEMVDKSRHNHLKQGPDPSVVIGLDADVDEMSLRRAEASFNDRYAGPENHGRAMFVTPTKTIQPLTTAPKDMSYESGFEQLRDAQLALHGVPLAAVGLSSPSGREGLYAPLLQFIELSVQPILTLLGEEDSALFNANRSRDVQIVYTAKKFNDEDLLEKQIQTDISAGILTKGELRKLRGREPFGDERDEEMCGASSSPAAPPGMPQGFPPGSIPGAPQQEVPAGQPTVSNPEQQAPAQAMPMGRAIQSGKPRIANQIAKALARELAQYGIFKGGPGSGNFGHSGRPGQVGGSAPDDGGGGGSAGASPSTSTRARPASNPSASALDETTRRILSRAAWTARNGIGGQEDFQRAIRDITTPSPYSQTPSREQAEAYYRHENELLQSYRAAGDTREARNQYARERARETNNFATISHGESRRILSGMSANGEGGWRIATAIANIGNPDQLARGLASYGMDRDAVEQAININNALHANQANAKEVARTAIEYVQDPQKSSAAQTFINDIIGRYTHGSEHNRLNEISDQPDPFISERAGTAQQREAARALFLQNQVSATRTATSAAGIERKIEPRTPPEPVDGLDAKETKLIKDIKERASSIKVSDEPAPAKDEFDRDEAESVASNEWPISDEYKSAIQEENERATENIRNFVAIPDSLPSSIGDMLEEHYVDLADRIGNGDEKTNSPHVIYKETEWFFNANKEEITSQLTIAAGGDSEKYSQLREEFYKWKSSVTEEASKVSERVSNALNDHYAEYVNEYVGVLEDEHHANSTISEPDDNTWYNNHFKFRTTSGQGFEITMNEDIRGLTREDQQKFARQRLLGYDLIFTDEKGSIQLTGESTEAKKQSGRSDELEVFRTVSSSVLGFIQNKDADVLTFTAIEEKRQKLYDKLTQTIAKIDGKYVAVSTGGGRKAAHYYVVKRDLKPYIEDMLREQAGQDDLKIDWLVKRFPGGYVKSSKHGWVQVRDYHFKGGPGSGNFGHEGRPGQVGGSAPDDGGGGGMAGAAPKEKEPKQSEGGKSKKRSGSAADKKEKAPKKKDTDADVKNPKILSVHPASKLAAQRNLKIDVSKSDEKDWVHAPSTNITKFNEENGFSRKSGTSIELVDYARELEKSGKKYPLLDANDEFNVENIERAAVLLADMTEEADAIDPTWAKWYSEIEQVTNDISTKEGKWQFSDKSRELLKTEEGKKLFVGFLALTSQQGAPDENLRSTKNLFDFYTANGRFPTAEEAEPMVLGNSAKIVADNTAKYAKVVEHFKGDVSKAFDFFNSPVQAGKVQEKLAAMGIEVKKVNNAFADQYVPHSYIFGPKIGAFHANLGGVEDLLTQDRWLTRTIGRITGEIGHTEQQIKDSWIKLRDSGAPTAEHVNYIGMSARDIKDAIKKVSEGGSLTDGEYAKLSKLAQAHIASSSKKPVKDRIIKRNEFTTALNTAIKKLSQVVDNPGGASSRLANQLAVETAVDVLKNRGRNFSVREVQAAVWMLEKKSWYDAGVGSKKGGVNSYTIAFNNLLENGEPSSKKKKKIAEEYDDEDSDE